MNNKLNRREFVKLASAAALAPGLGVASETAAQPPLSWALLMHFGRNMWGEDTYADHVRCDMEMWNRITDRMATVGANMLVIDLGEALAYPSHPELAVTGSWEPERLREELRRLRAMGIVPIPKLNFSACHDLWLKKYARMVATDEYYKVVSDVIADTCAIFDKPRYFHLGWDEEKYKTMRTRQYVVIRQNELWWHDMNFTVAEAEKHGSRGWIWSDKEWLFKDEFMAKCSRKILQSHWYYSSGFGPAWSVRDDKKMREAPWAEPYTLPVFKELDEAGFDQMPCGSNIYDDKNFPNVVKHCREVVSPKHLKGFLIAPWGAVEKGKQGDKYLRAVDLLGECRKDFEARG